MTRMPGVTPRNASSSRGLATASRSTSACGRSGLAIAASIAAVSRTCTGVSGKGCPGALASSSVAMANGPDANIAMAKSSDRATGVFMQGSSLGSEWYCAPGSAN